jgi:hypothetical protein
VLDQVGIAMITKASRELPDDARGPLGLTQQQTSGVRRDLAAVKTGHHLTPTQALETERKLVTLCRHKGCLPARHKSLFTKALCHRVQPFSISSVRNAG